MRVLDVFACACATLETRWESWCFKASKLKHKHQELAQAPGWKESSVALCASCIKRALGLWSQIGEEKKKSYVAWDRWVAAIPLSRWQPQFYIPCLPVIDITTLSCMWEQFLNWHITIANCSRIFLKHHKTLKQDCLQKGHIVFSPCSLYLALFNAMFRWNFWAFILPDSVLRSGSVLINAISRTLK